MLSYIFYGLVSSTIDIKILILIRSLQIVNNLNLSRQFLKNDVERKKARLPAELRGVHRAKETVRDFRGDDAITDHQ